MPLVVEVALDRKVPIYLSGEVVTVEIRVHNNGKARETLAWGSVQLTSDRTFGKRKAIDGGGTTAIAPSASNVFSSLPTVIFCDLDVAPGHSKTFPCNVPLPVEEIPPSFKGHYLRYTNRITVGVARIRSTVRLLHVPLRVLSSVGLDLKMPPPADPFLAQVTAAPSISQLVTAAVDVITAPRKPSVFSLTNQQGKIATLTLFKKAFRLGEEVVGHISFAGSSQSTLQLSACLETVESLSEEIPGAHANDPFITLHGKEEIVCCSVRDSNFRLPLPMGVSPTFHNDIVHFKWRLRFEFVMVDSIAMEENEDDPTLFQPPVAVGVDRLSWSTEIFVVPCSPHNASLTDHSPGALVSASI